MSYLKNDIEIIITDLFMPGGDGIEFIRALRELFPHTPVIVVSGSGAARRLGPFAVLTKPIDPEELFDTIAKAISERLRPGNHHGKAG
jgi:two-component system response regulator GlrR